MVPVVYEANLTEHGAVTPAQIIGYDMPKTAEEHYHDFVDLGGARVNRMENDSVVLECGVQSGLIAIQIEKGRGNFVPNLDPGSYGVDHTLLGNLLIKTKRVIDFKKGVMSLIFGVIGKQWPDGIYSCTLVQRDLKKGGGRGGGAIKLLADECGQYIEPTPGYRFYTPFQHISGAGSAFVGKETYPLYQLGIMTLDRTQLSELLRAFNQDWSNGIVFARKNDVHDDDDDDESTQPPPPPPGKKGGRKHRKEKEGVDRWC
jgi:hypothetical protein